MFLPKQSLPSECHKSTRLLQEKAAADAAWLLSYSFRSPATTSRATAVAASAFVLERREINNARHHESHALSVVLQKGFYQNTCGEDECKTYHFDANSVVCTCDHITSSPVSSRSRGPGSSRTLNASLIKVEVKDKTGRAKKSNCSADKTLKLLYQTL